MKKNKTLKLIMVLAVIISLIIVDFVARGLFRDYPFIVGFIVWFVMYLKFEIESKVYLGMAGFLFLSEFFLAVYRLDWLLNRIGAWVYFILLFVVFTGIIDLVKKKE